jgi:hypothetical protein
MLGSLVTVLPAAALEVAVRPGVTADLAEPAGVGAEARGC